MKQQLNEILTTLLSIQNKDISNINMNEGKFSFDYGGGKFVLIKSLSSDLKIGYLSLYHETPFEGDKHLIELKKFIIKITENGDLVEYKIKNHLNASNSIFNIQEDTEGYTSTDLEQLRNFFVLQLKAALINENDFKIYLS